MNYEISFIKSLLLTVIIEMFVVYLLTSDKSLKYRRVSAGVIPTLATLPYIWFVFPSFFRIGHYYIYFSESFAILVESWIIFLICNITMKRALFISFVANMSSYSIGLILSYLNLR